MTEIERKFNIAMRDIYETAKRKCGYNATRFMQMIAEKGGVAAAKQLIKQKWWNGWVYNFVRTREIRFICRSTYFKRGI